jgi:uncharacterized protein with HEPN domain
MLDTARKAHRKVAEINREGFDEDENLRLAVTHLLQTIGEAARGVSASGRADAPGIPWPAIVGMRHKVVHDYLNVDEDIVWRTARDELPALVAAIEAALANGP